MRAQAVVVATDGTEASRAAISWATAEALRRGQPLRVVHVLDWDWSAARYEFAGELFEDERQQAEALVAGVARRARAATPELEAESDLLIGDPAAQLIIDTESAGLMVLGHRGRGGFAGLRLGSVSQRVATHAHCPVAVIRDHALTTDDRPVVAGVDDSAAADDVLEAAFTAAAQRESGLVLIRAYPPRYPEAAVRERLAEQVAPWQNKFPDVQVETSVSPDGAASVLVGVSRGAQLVIVGSRGHGVIAGTLLGSTGLQLLHHAACPVLIIRPGRNQEATEAGS
ncbi:universal stress protein [Actinoplanes palleronii]|uniref:Universal stress protein n=1 Tax=Actinoplanes palleronii TaxID=113570 RepID=A0ABQ4BHL8_9ACTN|nr:universal stress protein [Actinoplanes palleronii]GIE70177.1 universal stress protein [Actinoplanes palleronii]